jgi:hypothetical protein
MSRKGSSAFLSAHRLHKAEVCKAQHLVASGTCGGLPRHYASEFAARFLHLYSEPLHLDPSVCVARSIPDNSGPIDPSYAGSWIRVSEKTSSRQSSA